MGKERNWLPAEYNYLQDNWGTVSLKGICKTLNRSENAVKLKVTRLGLGAFLDCGEYVTFNKLLKAIGYTGGTGYVVGSWIKNRGFPVKNKLVNHNNFRVVHLNDFWKWAETNKSSVDFSKMETGILGIEPEWVRDKRKEDQEKSRNFRTSPWTPMEDEYLKTQLKRFKFSYVDLSKMLGRTNGAIQRRIVDLGLKERPIKADNHTQWTPHQLATLCELIKKGTPVALMSEKIGKSEKATRGKIYTVYRTERLDAVRKMIDRGAWGDNAPTPAISDHCLLPAEKKAVSKDLAKLAGLLIFRRNQLGWEPYWQKDMCVHWDDFKGCTTNETNCDSCTSFQRISPQYCVRCGMTFFEREESKHCSRCREARKKQNQKKWAALYKKKAI